MFNAYGSARLGRDAELRYTGKGDPVCSLSLAFSYGGKDQEGNRQTQWVDASLWGRRAEGLHPYLVKGMAVSVALEALHIETYQGRNGEGTKLVARVSDIDLGANPNQPDESQGYREPQGRAPQTRQAPQYRRDGPPPRPSGARPPPPTSSAPASGGGSGFDDMDDDVPF